MIRGQLTAAEWQTLADDLSAGAERLRAGNLGSEAFEQLKTRYVAADPREFHRKDDGSLRERLRTAGAVAADAEAVRKQANLLDEAAGRAREAATHQRFIDDDAKQ